MIPQLHLLPRREVQLPYRDVGRRIVVGFCGFMLSLVCDRAGGSRGLSGAGRLREGRPLRNLLGSLSKGLLAEQFDRLVMQGVIHVGDGSIQVESDAQRHLSPIAS